MDIKEGSGLSRTPRYWLPKSTRLGFTFAPIFEKEAQSTKRSEGKKISLIKFAQRFSKREQLVSCVRILEPRTNFIRSERFKLRCRSKIIEIILYHFLIRLSCSIWTQTTINVLIRKITWILNHINSDFSLWLNYSYSIITCSKHFGFPATNLIVQALNIIYFIFMNSELVFSSAIKSHMDHSFMNYKQFFYK